MASGTPDTDSMSSATGVTDLATPVAVAADVADVVALATSPLARAVEMLREQLETERNRSVQAETRADRAER